jgi:hypothetical protein
MPRSSGRDSAEPWSEVPPELEEILRAQLSTKLSRTASPEVSSSHEAVSAETGNAPEAKAPTRRGGRRKPVESGEAGGPAEAIGNGEAPAEKAKPASRSRRKPAEASGEASGDVAAAAAPKKRAPARRRTAAAAAAAAAGEAIAEGGEGGEAPAGEPTGE